ncbi:polymorphic toxin type 50 domain-containing protein [Kluyvera cryocrescens]|uniref:polymorphic toxin type 50 domain-containing protein n=1 Tax=Kluyvera cryocrescens TaxID=580 RepID=UPI0028BD8829|nr:polymorphic toxin type 50 domain-containing protein [Kluyvera cryocrescens]MDU5634688.1 polymorphic toxin type 50 domain-containing protein [Staphylococcus epidermidis]WNN73822.1 polymorphic toxin type 50 domain-containing protein [Kluyvera cryocrescens]
MKAVTDGKIVGYQGAGTGRPIYETMINGKKYSIVGLAGSKERIDFGKPIGNFVDRDTGLSVPTTKGIVHYGKDGAHIVPARP